MGYCDDVLSREALGDLDVTVLSIQRETCRILYI